MAQQVGSLYYDLDINDGKLKDTLTSSDKQVKSFGDKIGGMGKTIQDGMNTAAKGLAVVGAGLTLYAKSAMDFTVDLVKSSKSLGKEIGVTTVEASRLVAAMGRMGVDAQSASQMFGVFSKQIVASTTNNEQNRLATEKLNIQIAQTQQQIKATTAEIAAHGDKTGALSLKIRDLNNTLATQKDALKQNSDSFQKLGISTVDGTGKQKDFEAILFEVADKFKTMPDGVDKTAISMDLFGRSGKEMTKVLNLGADGIRDLEKQADKLGLTLNAKTIGNVNDFVKSQKDLKEQTDAMKIAVGTATAPIMTEFNKRINDVVTGLLNASPAIKTATVDVLAFGGPVMDASAAALGFLANISSITEATAKMALGLSIGVAVLAIIAGAVYLVIQHFGGWRAVLADIHPLLDRMNQLMHDAADIGKAAFADILKAADDAGKMFGAFLDWVNKNKQALIDTGIVLGVIVGPALIKLGVQAIIAGAQMAASAVAAGAVWVFQSVVAGVAWIGQFIAMEARAIATAVVFVAQAIIGGWAWIIQGGIVAATWLIGFASMIIGAIGAGISIAAAGIMAALPWIIAFAPVLLVIAAVAAAAWLIYSNWGAISNFFIGLFNGVIGWLAGNWPIIVAIITGPIGWAVYLIARNWDTIKSLFAQGIGWLAGLFGNVVNIIVGPFKAAFNAVAGLWNRSMGSLSFNVPGWVPGIGGKGFSLPKMPMLAEGGVVDAPTIAMLGEAGKEAVMPLSQLDRYNSLFSRIEASAAKVKPDGDAGNTTNFNAPVNIYDREDAHNILAIISRNQELASRGLTAVRGSTP